MDRRQIGTGVLAMVTAMLFFVAAFHATPATAADRNIRVHIYAGAIIDTLVYVARDKGLYKANGLDVALVPITTGPQAVAALAGGSVDFVLNTMDNALISSSKGFPVRCVVGNQVRNFYSLVVASRVPLQQHTYPGVMKELVGKSVGVIGRGTNIERMARSLYRNAGLSPDSATYVGVGVSTTALPAMEQGQIDMNLAFEPFQTIATVKNLGRVVVDMRKNEGPEEIIALGPSFQCFFTSAKFIAEHRNAVDAFVKSHVEAERWMKDPKNFDELVRIVGSFAPMPPGVSDPTGAMRLMLKESLVAFGVTIDPRAIDAWNKFLVGEGLLSAPVSVDQVLWPGAPRP